MKYLLDTNICIYIIKKKPIKVINKFKKIINLDVCISVITLSELMYGVEKSQNPEKNKIALIEFLAPINILSFGNKASIIYGKIRADLEKKGTPIGALDMFIAAHAISLDLILISNNLREFSRVRNLKFENWV